MSRPIQDSDILQEEMFVELNQDKLNVLKDFPSYSIVLNNEKIYRVNAAKVMDRVFPMTFLHPSFVAGKIHREKHPTVINEALQLIRDVSFMDNSSLPPRLPSSTAALFLEKIDDSYDIGFLSFMNLLVTGKIVTTVKALLILLRQVSYYTTVQSCYRTRCHNKPHPQLYFYVTPS